MLIESRVAYAADAFRIRFLTKGDIYIYIYIFFVRKDPLLTLCYGLR